MYALPTKLTTSQEYAYIFIKSTTQPSLKYHTTLFKVFIIFQVWLRYHALRRLLRLNNKVANSPEDLSSESSVITDIYERVLASVPAEWIKHDKFDNEFSSILAMVLIY